MHPWFQNVGVIDRIGDRRSAPTGWWSSSRSVSAPACVGPGGLTAVPWRSLIETVRAGDETMKPAAGRWATAPSARHLIRFSTGARSFVVRRGRWYGPEEDPMSDRSWRPRLGERVRVRLPGDRVCAQAPHRPEEADRLGQVVRRRPSGTMRSHAYLVLLDPAPTG